MAISRLSYSDKVFQILGLFSLLMLIHRGGAFEFKVGGSSGWSVPSDAQSYNQWASKNRFQIGDTLLFVYPSEKDVVLQVTKEHYTNCTIATPIAKFTDGHTVYKFNQSGPFYFISASKDNCMKNEKLHVIVLADRTATKNSPPPPMTPSPAPMPSSVYVPSSPPEANSSPAPSSDQPQNQTPPKNGAHSAVTSVVGLFGCFFGSLIFFGI